MLRQLLCEVEATQGPLDLNELGRRLDVERGALDGMIQFWVRKGRLIDNRAAAEDAAVCAPGHCGGCCPGPQSCPFTMKMPRTYSLRSLGIDEAASATTDESR